MVDDSFRVSMNESDQESLRQSMSAADRFAEGVAQFLLAHHLVLYYSSSEEKRTVVLRGLEDAVARNVDVTAGLDTTTLEWRRSWPAAARAAILALWRTPKT
jgi:hypothetical protein